MTALWHDVRRFWELNVSDQLTIDALEDRTDADSAPADSRGKSAVRSSSASLTPLPDARSTAPALPFTPAGTRPAVHNIDGDRRSTLPGSAAVATGGSL